tara:strand:- start:169 stop:480 length:312 start_codon:yes stop_codon:yes gene_type:complete
MNEDDLMIQTDQATDQEVLAPNPVQVLFLTNQMILIAEIDEVLADIGQPDCKLINPCVIVDGKLSRWLSDLTINKEMFMSSDKILTLVDPTPKLLNDYIQFVR